MAAFDIKDIIRMGSEIAKPFVPGAAGQILDIVRKNIDDDGDPANAGGLKAVAKNIEDLIVVAQDQERRLRKLEAKAGL